MARQRRKVGGYIWRDKYYAALRLHKEMLQQLVEINHNRNTTSERLVKLALLIAESREALEEMAEIAEGNKKGE